MNYYSLMNDNSVNGDRPGGRGTRAARQRARTRAALLAAARRVFAARGFHDASVAEITAAADVGVGTFYLHFRDKDEALRALVQEGLAEVRDHLVAAVGDTSPERSLPPFLHTLFREAYARRDLFAIALGSGTRPGRAARAALIDYLEGMLAAAAHRGLLEGYAEDDVPLLAHLLGGVVTQAILWWLDQDEPGPEAMAARVLRLLRDGLPTALLMTDVGDGDRDSGRRDG